MHFYVTGYKFGMMVLVSLSFSRCVNFDGRGQVLVLKGLVLITTLPPVQDSNSIEFVNMLIFKC